MAIRAVIFDMGGVLIRTGDYAARRKWEIQFGLPKGKLSHLVFGSPVAARAMSGQASEQDVWQDIACSLKLDDDQLIKLIADFWSCENLNTELTEFARSLRPKYKTAILSNAFSTARQAVTENFQLDTAFDPIIVSGEVGLAKPDARIFHLAVERIGVTPGEAIFIDDVLENIEAARAVGMRGVQFKDTAQAIAEVRRYLEDGIR